MSAPATRTLQPVTPVTAEVHTIYYVWAPALPHVYEVGRGGTPIQSIILHSTDGRLYGDLDTLRGKTDRQVSAHWYITRGGSIYHLVADADTAWHAGKVKAEKYANRASIGIEQEHYDGREVWMAQQVKACARLCAYLCQEHGLAVEDIVGHAEAAPGRKQDPKGYPWERFRTLLAEKRLYRWQVCCTERMR